MQFEVIQVRWRITQRSFDWCCAAALVEFQWEQREKKPLPSSRLQLFITNSISLADALKKNERENEKEWETLRA